MTECERYFLKITVAGELKSIKKTANSNRLLWDDCGETGRPVARLEQWPLREDNYVLVSR